MKSPSWIPVVLLSVYACAPCFSKDAARTLSLAATQWAPYTGKIGDGRVAYELVEESLRRAGYAAQLDIVEEGRLTEAVVTGEYQGSPAFWRNAPRARFLLFSAPYLENRLVLVGRKGSDVSAAGLADLAGKKLGLIRAYGYGEAPGEIEGIVRVYADHHRENLTRLIRGEVDYVLLDALLAHYLIEYQSSEAEAHLEIGTKPLLRRTLHFVLNPDVPGAPDIIDAFNAGIADMLADGTYNRILNLNWIEADVDGDGKMELVLSGAKAGTVAPSHRYGFSPLKETSPGDPPPDRYWIEGEIYDDWDSVPDRYKIDLPRFRDSSNTGISIYQFDF